MGNNQSRQQPRDPNEAGDDRDHRSSIDGSNHEHASHTDVAAGASRRKRRRDSASLIGASAEHASQRRRTSPRRSASPTSELQQSSSATTSDAMDLDPSQVSTASAAPSAAHTSFAGQAHEAATLPNVEQQPAVVLGDGSTPPPHLDVLRDERERARRRILETLGAGDPIATPAPSSSDTSPASVATPRAPPSTSRFADPSPPSAADTVAALLGAAAAVHAASASLPRVDDVSSAAPALDASAPTATTTSQTNPQQQQHPQNPRPQAFRVPLQPEMISGTSMVVQGALVARTMANRSASPNPSTSTESSQSSNAQGATILAPSSSSSQPQTVHRPSTGARDEPGVAGANLEGDNLRGAVTLEEQAVMLSRILGIAAAATAASLLNTAEAQQVDPSLLQTSLRRPFERMSQTTGEGNDRWLADWQRAGHNSPSSASPSGVQASPAPASELGHGLRGRLAALSRRVQSASSSSGLPSSQHDTTVVNQTSSSSADSARANIADDGNADSNESYRQQEIIAHLLGAAERQATAQTLNRPRSADQPAVSVAAGSSDTSGSASSIASRSPAANGPQQEPARSSLSRLVRSTIGSLVRPSRLFTSLGAQTLPAQSSGPHRSGWVRGSTGRVGGGGGGTGIRSVPLSDFSLGPNDVAGSLRQVRNGILPDGVPGSFGSFMNHLVNDLMAAVQLMRPSSDATPERSTSQTPQTSNYFEHATPGEATSGAEVLDGETRTDPANPSSQAQTAQAAASASSNDAHINPSSGTNEESVETQAARQRDFQNGNLSFFRLFRFDPIAPSHLVPCIVVGVRSLNVTERFGEEMTGAPAPSPGREFNGSRQQTSRPTTLGRTRPTAPLPRQRASSEGAAASATTTDESAEGDGEELPASRFMLFVSGGRYPPNHPLLTSNPTTAGRDLMILMDLLSTMQAMQHKPATVTQQEIDASDLKKIKGSEVAAMVRDSKITENTLERCLVCLEEWGDDDDCRILACRHAFHTGCVDRWMTSSSNTCPMCRRQGVSKDGRQAGAETADSRRAAQA